MFQRLQYVIMSLRKNLMFRFAFGVIVPVLIVMVSMAMMHYYRELRLFEGQIELNSSRIADLLEGNLRASMLANDHKMLNESLLAGSKLENLERIQVINLAGEVTAAFPSRFVGTKHDRDTGGCAECHSIPAPERPRLMRFSVDKDTVRVAAPIVNEPACFACHNNDDTHLGMLLIDISLTDIESHLREDLTVEMLITLATILVMLAGIYLMMQRLLLRRMRRLREPLIGFAKGNFTARLPVEEGPPNELDYLAVTFNEMADSLEKANFEREERTALRERAIREERERIARELHDGFAQLLGYVSTKAIAARLFLRKGKITTAKTHLAQLEDASQEMFLDVREAILGLKMSGDCCDDFLEQVQEYAKDFSRLSNIPVTFHYDAASIFPELSGEIELQLLRIIQEALTNIRKHAFASHATIKIEVSDSQLTLIVEDDGVGMSTGQLSPGHRPRFGLTIMKERATSIDATFLVVTRPEIPGTKIIVKLPLHTEME